MIYLGLDVSKDTVDAQLCVDVRYTHYKITNDAAGNPSRGRPAPARHTHPPQKINKY